MVKLHIKNMVCNRCIIVVKSELEKLGLNYLSVELGEVTFKNVISQEDKISISKHLKAFGFEILNDTKSKTIEKIKSTLIGSVASAKIKHQVLN